LLATFGGFAEARPRANPVGKPARNPQSWPGDRVPGTPRLAVAVADLPCSRLGHGYDRAQWRG